MKGRGPARERDCTALWQPEVGHISTSKASRSGPTGATQRESNAESSASRSALVMSGGESQILSTSAP